MGEFIREEYKQLSVGSVYWVFGISDRQNRAEFVGYSKDLLSFYQPDKEGIDNLYFKPCNNKNDIEVGENGLAEFNMSRGSNQYFDRENN